MYLLAAAAITCGVFVGVMLPSSRISPKIATVTATSVTTVITGPSGKQQQQDQQQHQQSQLIPGAEITANADRTTGKLANNKIYDKNTDAGDSVMLQHAAPAARVPHTHDGSSSTPTHSAGSDSAEASSTQQQRQQSQRRSTGGGGRDDGSDKRDSDASDAINRDRNTANDAHNTADRGRGQEYEVDGRPSPLTGDERKSLVTEPISPPSEGDHTADPDADAAAAAIAAVDIPVVAKALTSFLDTTPKLSVGGGRDSGTAEGDREEDEEEEKEEGNVVEEEEEEEEGNVVEEAGGGVAEEEQGRGGDMKGGRDNENSGDNGERNKEEEKEEESSDGCSPLKVVGWESCPELSGASLDGMLTAKRDILRQVVTVLSDPVSAGKGGDPNEPLLLVQKLAVDETDAVFGAFESRFRGHATDSGGWSPEPGGLNRWVEKYHREVLQETRPVLITVHVSCSPRRSYLRSLQALICHRPYQ